MIVPATRYRVVFDKQRGPMTTEAAESHPIVAACAKDRAEAALAPYTVRCAIADARKLRAIPDASLDTFIAKRMIDTLLTAIDSSTCFRKAVENGEEVFVLRQIDRAAIEPIHRWADAAQAHGCREEKVLDARHMAERWEAQPIEKTRWPT